MVRFTLIFSDISQPKYLSNTFLAIRVRFGGHVGGKQTPDTLAVNEILLFKFLQHGRHDLKCKPRIY